MKTKILIGLVALVFAASLISAGMPDEQCYKMASEKDNALENTLELIGGGGLVINPCTGGQDTWSYYRSDNNGVTNLRRVYGNGDADGYIGLTRYWVCHSSGTAKIQQIIYYPWGYPAWGFYWNFPFDDDPSTWVKDKEICNTL